MLTGQIFFLRTNPVLATCDIRPPNEAFKNTKYGLSLLADFPEGEENQKHSPTHLHEGAVHTVHHVLNSIQRLTRMCFQLLQHSFIHWTKLLSTSLLLGTVTDLARSKPELMAENALLRKPLIILRRQVKRPVFKKTDRMLLVLLARAVRAWKQALFIIQEDDPPALASPGIQVVLEGQVQSGFFQTEDLRRHRGVDQGDGKEQSLVGSGTDPWRIPQAGASPQQTYDPEGHAERAYDSTKGPDLESLPPQSC